jgi:hypothetical protein
LGAAEPRRHFNPRIFTMLSKGEELALPNFGLETAFIMFTRTTSPLCSCARLLTGAHRLGEAFHAVSPAAITLRGYAEAMATWFGREAKLRYLPGKGEHRLSVDRSGVRTFAAFLV